MTEEFFADNPQLAIDNPSQTVVMLLQASLYLLPNEWEAYTGIFYGWMLTAYSFSVCFSESCTALQQLLMTKYLLLYRAIASC